MDWVLIDIAYRAAPLVGWGAKLQVGLLIMGT